MVSVRSFVRTNFFVSSSISSPGPFKIPLSDNCSKPLMQFCRYSSNVVCMRVSTNCLFTGVRSFMKKCTSIISRFEICISNQVYNVIPFKNRSVSIVNAYNKSLFVFSKLNIRIIRMFSSQKLD
jgi:hypothetical protein